MHELRVLVLQCHRCGWRLSSANLRILHSLRKIERLQIFNADASGVCEMDLVAIGRAMPCLLELRIR